MSRALTLFLPLLAILVVVQPVGAQSPSMYLPALNATHGTAGGLALVNSDSTDAEVTITARTYDGALITGPEITNPSKLKLQPRGKLELLLEEALGKGIGNAQGWLEITPSSAAVKAYSFFFDAELTFLEGAGVALETSGHLVFPKISMRAATALRIVNTSLQPVLATIAFYDNAGRLTAVSPLSFGGQSGVVRNVSDFGQLDASFEGYAVVQTTGSGPFAAAGLVGFETYRNTADIAGMRAVPASAQAKKGYWPHYVSQGGYSTRLTLINNSDTTQVVQITAQNGAQAMTAVKTLWPRERFDQTAAEIFSLAGANLITGDIRFETQTEAPGVIAVLEYTASYDGSLTAAEPQARAEADFHFTHLAEAAGYYTGLAFLNGNPEPATVLIDLFDKSGVVKASATVDFAAGERRASLIDEFFQEAITQVGGYIRVSATQPVFAQEFLGSTGQAAFLASVPGHEVLQSSTFPATTTGSAPSITSLSPSAALIDRIKSLNLRIAGSGFSRDSVVHLNGVKIKTSFINSTLLAITLSNPQLKAGVHTIQVFNPGASASNTAKLLLAYGTFPTNQPPVVNAGVNQSITLPAAANVSGTASDDLLPLEGTLKTAWSSVSGPSAGVFGDSNSLSTSATFSAAGTYVLRLTASDGALSSAGEITITVNAAPVPVPAPAPAPAPAPIPEPEPAPLPETSLGTKYYVSNSGSDSNAGTSPSTAWKTIAKVQSFLANLRPGDSVLFERGGIWYEQLDVNNVNGTADARITFGNYGTGNLPIIDGGGTKSGYTVTGGRQWCIGGTRSKMSYLTIDGFECRHTSAYGIAFVGVSSGSAGIIVQNSYIHDTGDGDYGYHNQLMFFEWNYGAAYGTKFLNNKVGNCFGHNCIQIHGDRGSPVIQGNECYGFAHNCIDVKYVQGAVVDSNVVHDGLGIQSSANALYIQNETTSYTGDATFSRNVVYGTGITRAIHCRESGGPVTCRIYNNTIYNVNGVNGTYSTNVANLRVYAKNNIFDTNRPRVGYGYVEWDYNDTVQSAPVGPHDIQVNPQYVNAAGRDFRLQPGSGVIDKGTGVNLPYVGSAPDLGAFEFSQ